MRPSLLTTDTVHEIRTTGRSDAYWERTLGVSRTAINKARIGVTWKTHPTPPDCAPRVKRQQGSGGRPETQHLPQMSDRDRLLSQLLAKWPRAASVEVA